MKKIFLLIAIVIMTSGGYYYYLKSDKKVLKNFANELVDESNSTKSIIKKYVKYTEKGELLSLSVLNSIKQEHKNQGGQISIYSASEAGKNSQNNQIKLQDGERLYYIKFSEEIIWPFIVNNESKIIVLLILTKGKEGGILSDSRSDK